MAFVLVIPMSINIFMYLHIIFLVIPTAMIGQSCAGTLVSACLPACCFDMCWLLCRLVSSL